MVKAVDLIEKFRYALDNKWGYIWGTAGEKWTEAKQKELEKTTDSNRAQGRKYGSKWIGHTVADCSGLFSWAYKQLGGYMYHGSDTMYKKYCVDHGELSKGKRTDGKPLKPGTAVFVWNGSTYSHVGLFVGKDTVIEAMGTISGVTTTKVTAGKWTHWGELKDVDLAAQEPQEGASLPKDDKILYPTIKRGNKGENVRILQQLLMERGYRLPRYGADGDFGSETEAAVKAFQKANGLKVDGIAGPATWGKLLEQNITVKYTFTAKGITKAMADELKKICDKGTITEDKE